MSDSKKVKNVKCNSTVTAGKTKKLTKDKDQKQLVLKNPAPGQSLPVATFEMIEKKSLEEFWVKIPHCSDKITEKDLVEAFHPSVIRNIRRLKGKKTGKPSGSVIVQFVTKKDLQYVLDYKSRIYIGSCYIEVEEYDRMEKGITKSVQRQMRDYFLWS